MRIGALARVTGLDRSTMRFYEQVGVFPSPPRLDNGYRDYDERLVELGRFVRAARSLGFTLHDIREVVRLRESGTAPCAQVRRVIDARIAGVGQQIADLLRAHEELIALRDEAASLDDRWEEASCVCHLVTG
ncbi:MAG: MerR family DNA-binding protein [Acidimicrobiia bacterium]